MILEIDNIRIYEENDFNRTSSRVGDIVEIEENLFGVVKEKLSDDLLKVNILLNGIEKNKEQMIDELIDHINESSDVSAKVLLKFINEYR